MTFWISEYTGNVWPVHVVARAPPVAARIRAYCAVFVVNQDDSCGSANAEALIPAMTTMIIKDFIRFIPWLRVERARAVHSACTPRCCGQLLSSGGGGGR